MKNLIKTKKRKRDVSHGKPSPSTTIADKAAFLRRAIRTVTMQQVDGTPLDNISARDLRVLKRIHRAATQFVAVWGGASPREQRSLRKLLRPEMERLRAHYRTLGNPD